jgi:hypothetical protein
VVVLAGRGVLLLLDALESRRFDLKLKLKMSDRELLRRLVEDEVLLDEGADSDDDEKNGGVDGVME